MRFVKVIRFDNRGFESESPNSSYTNRRTTDGPIFINRKVTDLFVTSQHVFTSEMIQPMNHDGRWSGCFCFLNEHELPTSSNVRQRWKERRHIAFLSMDSVIWVRNLSHIEGEPRYFSHCTFQLEDGKTMNKGKILPNTWVQMSVKDALERTRLWKEKHQTVPEWLTECFLVQKQIEHLYHPREKEKVMEFWLTRN